MKTVHRKEARDYLEIKIRLLFSFQEFVKIKGKKQSLTKCITKTAEQSIKEVAERRNDEALLPIVSGVDLLAREAHYHNSCRRAFTRNVNRRSLNSDPEVAIMLEVHRNHLSNFVVTLKNTLSQI